MQLKQYRGAKKVLTLVEQETFHTDKKGIYQEARRLLDEIEHLQFTNQ